MMGRQFQLSTYTRKGNEKGIVFSEHPSEDTRNSKGRRTGELRLWGLPFKVMTETILKTLKRQGYRPTDFSIQRKEPFLLDEASGVRLGLFLFALKPLRKVSRMEAIIAGIDNMSDEEAYYWYAKCTNGRRANQARKAMRILLSGE